MSTKTYRLLKADLLGNDDDGYEWNDSYSCGIYNIPDSAITGTDRDFLSKLVKLGVFDSQALACTDLEIDFQSDGIDEEIYIDFYFEQNAPRSKESFQLVPIAHHD